MTPSRRRAGVLLALASTLVPLGGVRPDDVPALKTETFRGRVVPLAVLLAESGVKLDPDAAPAWLALRGEDGKVYPLVKDAGARLFFKDARLRDRPMRLTGRLVPGSQLLQVVAVQSYRGGALQDLYYWCDICTIKSHDPDVCGCCGGPVELREEPARGD